MRALVLALRRHGRRGGVGPPKPAGQSGGGGRPDARLHRATIRVDVIGRPTASGRGVGTLKAADFELREDGTLQSIDDARSCQG